MKKGATEPFGVRKLFARTDQTQCLSERFGQTDQNRRVGLSLNLHCNNMIFVYNMYILGEF